jgi:four helix bundle suffix protein
LTNRGRGEIKSNVMDTENEKLIPAHGGYRKLKSFQIDQLVYDVTVYFCDKYVSRFSRTYDPMIQAGRSGVQNIAEVSQASGTSKKTELKLTNAARASLEELRLDYEDFLRQRELPKWEPDHPALKRFKARRCSTLEEVRQWAEKERKQSLTKDRHQQSLPDTGSQNSGYVRECPCQSVSTSAMIANAALSLLNLCCYLLDRRLAVQAETFENECGFTKRLYGVRQDKRI